MNQKSVNEFQDLRQTVYNLREEATSLVSRIVFLEAREKELLAELQEQKCKYADLLERYISMMEAKVKG